MGFFSNVGNGKAVKEILANDVYEFLKSHTQEFAHVRGNIQTSNPDLVTLPLTLIDNHLNRIEDNAKKSYMTDNEVFAITDDYKVTFKLPICIIKLKEIPPFNLDAPNIVALKTCGNDVMDWIPEQIRSLTLINTHRSDNSLGFKNLTYVETMAVTGDTHIKSLKGLEKIEVFSMCIKNCTKIETTDGCPMMGVDKGLRTAYTNSRFLLDKTPNVTISSCKELVDLCFPQNCPSKINIFITEKTCPKISKVVSLPNEVGFIGCKNLSTDDFRNINSTIDYIEVNDFKGKGAEAFNRHLSSREEVIEKLKGIVDDIRSKHWRIFDDLAAVLTYYGLDEYANIGKSGYVENGMIRSYSPMVDLGGRYHHEFSRDNIKKGVTRYLNQLGVKYTIINTDPKKSKDYEFIKIEG